MSTTAPAKSTAAIPARLNLVLLAGSVTAAAGCLYLASNGGSLALKIGVSRPSLRSGLRSLQAMGVVQARQGAGTLHMVVVEGV